MHNAPAGEHLRSCTWIYHLRQKRCYVSSVNSAERSSNGNNDTRVLFDKQKEARQGTQKSGWLAERQKREKRKRRLLDNSKKEKRSNRENLRKTRKSKERKRSKRGARSKRGDQWQKRGKRQKRREEICARLTVAKGERSKRLERSGRDGSNERWEREGHGSLWSSDWWSKKEKRNEWKRSGSLWSLVADSWPVSAAAFDRQARGLSNETKPTTTRDANTSPRTPFVETVGSNTDASASCPVNFRRSSLVLLWFASNNRVFCEFSLVRERKKWNWK